jgi:hypothetical protein
MIGAARARQIGAVAGVAAFCAGLLTAPGGRAAGTTPPPGGRAAAPGGWGATAASPCDPLAASQCMLPFPDDFYTVSDPSMPTGRRVYFPPGAFPTAVGSTAFTAAPWEDNDGFSPGSTILTHVPGISLSASHVATISDMGTSLQVGSPVVLLDATTKTRWPTWTELDVNDHDPSTQLLIVHPARNLTEGDRYIIALRNLKTASGLAIPPGTPFGSVLRGHGAVPGLAAAYTAHLRGVVNTLAHAGVPAQGMFEAWDFTVASTRNITQPALTMRDETFAALGKKVGPYTVTRVVNDPPGQPSLSREVFGTFDVPSYLSGPGGSASSVLTVGPSGLPVHEPGHTEAANFECEIPKAATAAHPAAVGFYGHGLFNSASEVTASWVPQFSNAYDYVFCSTDWMGLSSSTLGLAATVVTDLAKFPALVDNLLQSLLDAQVLGNLLVNPTGFASNPAFRGADRHALIRPSAGLVYYGNSEGGIMGGAFTALSTEVRRSVLGVPGMDYAVLLPRSADFAPFQGSLDAAYPDPADQVLGLDLIQMLWDRADADGYAEQMLSGLPGTPRHHVLMEEAFGDHQVANVTTETEARTIGAAIHQPALAPGRSAEKQPFWDLPTLTASSRGPALFVWDTGVPAAPLTDTPPTTGPDPHDTTPRSFPSFWGQMHTFFSTGRVSDPCGPHPCRGPYPPAGS